MAAWLNESRDVRFINSLQFLFYFLHLHNFHCKLTNTSLILSDTRQQKNTNTVTEYIDFFYKVNQ